MYAAEFTTKINNGKIDVPPQYRDRFNSDVKVILLDAVYTDITVKTQKSEAAKGFGALSHRADRSLWEQEENAWERSVVDRYDND